MRLFSALTAAVIFYGMRPRFGHATARNAAWLWALYPYAIYYSAVYLWDCALTSLLFSTCFFLGLNRLHRMRLPGWAAYGGLAGLAALSNPSILSLLPFLLGYACCGNAFAPAGRSPLPLLTALSFALLLTVAPWTIRNFEVMHQPVLMRDGFWAEFYAGNCRRHPATAIPGWTHPASNPAEMLQYQQRGETGLHGLETGTFD